MYYFSPLYFSPLFAHTIAWKNPIWLTRSINSFAVVVVAVAYCRFVCVRISHVRIYACILCIYMQFSLFLHIWIFEYLPLLQFWIPIKWICFHFHRRYFLGQSKLSPALPFCMHIYMYITMRAREKKSAFLNPFRSFVFVYYVCCAVSLRA